MILVHKPQAIHHHGPVYHRRNPSAPLPALVQPTKTPGLLSLSKPAQPAQKSIRSSPKPKQKAAVGPLQPAAEIVELQPVKVSQSPERRGQAANPKAKPTARSVSNRHRQQTPPIINPSQAEDTTTSKPFFDSFSTHSSPNPLAPTLKLASKPSGKLARRRQLFNETTTPPKAIPVPTNTRNKTPTLYKRASAPPVFTFPICDDISELGDQTDVDDVSPPATPTRPKRQNAHTSGYTYGFEDGPKTAPLSSSGSLPIFPFNQPASLRGSPTAKRVGPSRPRRHFRSPSEGVFHMSDEEKDSIPSLSSSSGTSSFSSLNSSPSDELKALFGLGSLGKKQRAMFASSTFLNSPDPEELPPPSF